MTADATGGVPPEQVRRMRAHAKALARRGDGCYGDHGCRKHWVSMNAHVWMPMARHWRMSIKQVQAIVRPERSTR